MYMNHAILRVHASWLVCIEPSPSSCDILYYLIIHVHVVFVNVEMKSKGYLNSSICCIFLCVNYICLLFHIKSMFNIHALCLPPLSLISLF